MPAALILALLAAAAPRALPAGRPALVVSVEQDTRERFDAAALREIDRAVGDVWRPYADVAVRDQAATLTVAADDVLTLVITDRLSESGDGLGWIQFVDGQPSHTIYVSRTEADRLAARARIGGRPLDDWPPKVGALFLRRAVAMAIAHEVGHYLLRSTAHADTGLMRSRFTANELLNASVATYRLDGAEESIMRQRTRGYLLARNGLRDVPMP